MGLPGAWENLSGIAIRTTLQELATQHRINAVENVQARSTFTVAIDLEPVMRSCNGGVKAASVSNQPPGGGMYNFTRFFMTLLHAAISIVGVTDGPDKPGVKRDHRVVSTPIAWQKQAERFIKINGHRVIHAPGEAEAELARLNQDGLVDAVMTADSDVFIFGAKMVLRPLKKDDRHFRDEFLLYRSEDLPRIGLSQNALIMAALARGADYDHGLQDCGIKTALALGRCGFGDTLIDAYESLGGNQLTEFLDDWRAAVKAELVSNSQDEMSGRQPKIADAIGPDFPNLHVLKLYLCPAVLSNHHELPALYLPHQPQIDQVTKFFKDSFYFDNETVLKRFSDSFFEAVCLQAIYSPLGIYDISTETVKTPSIHLPIRNVSLDVRGQSKATGGVTGRQIKLKVAAQPILDLMGPGFATKVINDISVWPPTALLPAELAAGLSGSGKGFLESVPTGPSAPNVPEVVEVDSESDDEYDMEYPPDLFQNEAGPSTAPAAGPSRRGPLQSLTYLDLTDPNATAIEYEVDEKGVIIVED